jgi:hypothetical protein
MKLARWALAMVAACLVVALSACSDNSPPDDQRTPPPTSSAASSAPPTAVPTPARPGKYEMNPESAEAFVRYFWDVVNYSFATGQTELLRTLSDDTCTFCSSTVEEIGKLKSDGSHVEGGEVSVTGVAVPPLTQSKAIATAVLQQGAGRVIGSDGKVVSTSEEHKDLRTDVLVQWRKDRWVVLDVSFGGPTETTPP